MKNMFITITLLLATSLLTACASSSNGAANGCTGSGSYFTDNDAVGYCAYAVVVTGFRCPDAFPIDNVFTSVDGSPVHVCSTRTVATTADLPGTNCVGLNLSGCAGAGVTVTQAQCEAAFDEQIQVCTTNNEVTRACAWRAMRSGCASGLNRVAALGYMNCFAGDTICRSPGDPGTTANITCTQSVLAAVRNSTTDAARVNYCNTCSNASQCSEDTMEREVYLYNLSSPAVISSVDGCLAAATECISASIQPCLDATPSTSPWDEFVACNP